MKDQEMPPIEISGSQGAAVGSGIVQNNTWTSKPPPDLAALSALNPHVAVARLQRLSHDDLVDLFFRNIAAGPPLYPTEEYTTQPERFFAAEIVREKLFRLTGDELPYTSTVVIDRYEIKPELRTALEHDDVGALAPLVNAYLLRFYFQIRGMPQDEFIARLHALKPKEGAHG